MTYGSQTYNIATPANCTLTVHGYKNTTNPAAGAKPDVNVAFTYVPQLGTDQETGTPNAQMTTAKLPSTFAGLKAVVFNATLVRGAGGAKKTYYTTPPIVRLDTFKYVTRNLTGQA